MRELTRLFRERAFDPSRLPALAGIEFARRHQPTWLIAIIGAILLAGVGAYDTDHAPGTTLAAYWLILMFLACGFGAAALDWLGARLALVDRPVLTGLGILFGVTVLMTPIVWLAAAFAMGGSWHPARMVELVPQVILVVGVITILQVVAYRRQSTFPAGTPISRASSELRLGPIARLLGGNRLYAVQAEDHYLRFHTDRGSPMVLMRMGDALAELEGYAGARTHRSWWVARDAVRSVERGGGKAILTLANGMRVPVSRSYARALRQDGWY